MNQTSAAWESYSQTLSEERKPIITQIRQALLANLPNGFEEVIQYGMLSYVVPHSIYPAGYHCDVKQPLPFIGLASQKGHIGLYHMGIYADENLLNWFQNRFARTQKKKLDMGKSCIRFKKAEDVPLDVIGELASKMSPNDWIALYESKFRKGSK